MLDGQTLTSTSGALSVKATQDATIDALSVAASIGIGIGASAGIAFSGAGATAKNTINDNTIATVVGSTLDSDGAVTVEAISTSKITAKIAALSLAVGASAGPGVGAAIGVSVAINQIGNWTVPVNPVKADGTPDPTRAPTFNAANSGGVSATIIDSGVTADDTLTVHAKAGQTIDALVISGAVALGAGTVGVGVAGAGVYTENMIGVLTEASITGKSSADKATIRAANVNVSAEDVSHITANAGAAAISAAIGTVSVGVSFGVAVAKNTIANDVDAYLDFADVEVTDIPVHNPTYTAGVETNVPAHAAAPGTITVSASEGATIDAITAAAAVAISGGAVSVSVAGGGAVALNTILGGTRAYATDSVLDAGGVIGFSASNTSVINAHVLAAAVGVAIGGVAVGASLGFGVALNNIGYKGDGTRSGVEVSAYLQDTDVDSYGALGVIVYVQPDDRCQRGGGFGRACRRRFCLQCRRSGGCDGQQGGRRCQRLHRWRHHQGQRCRRPGAGYVEDRCLRRCCRGGDLGRLCHRQQRDSAWRRACRQSDRQRYFRLCRGCQHHRHRRHSGAGQWLYLHRAGRGADTSCRASCPPMPPKAARCRSRRMRTPR